MIEEFIIDQVKPYGIIGVFILVLLIGLWWFAKRFEKLDAQRDNRENELKEVVKNNTIALTRTYENIRYCQKRNGN